MSRNVVFDELSSWWSSNQEKPPDSNKLKEEVKSSSVELTFGNGQITVEEEETVVHRHQPW